MKRSFHQAYFEADLRTCAARWSIGELNYPVNVQWEILMEAKCIANIPKHWHTGMLHTDHRHTSSRAALQLA